MLSRVLIASTLAALPLLFAGCAASPDPRAGATPPEGLGSVIFIHPDGTSSGSWTAARALHYGPDGDLHWDRLPAIALYRGHMKDRLTATSNGGATTHAYGVKVESDAFGRSAGGDRGEDIVDPQGHSLSVARQAIRAGLPVGLVQTGSVYEPGTAAFVASAVNRNRHAEIAAQVVESGAAVLFSGGEEWFLPEGVEGVHGPGARKDGRNLLDEARQKGYTVIRTRDELLHLPDGAEKVLGVFARGHTFNDRPEEQLAEAGLEPFDPDAPTVAEMTEAALRVLDRQGRRFLLVVEEEGTDNLGNHRNAPGMLEAMKRADDAIGVARAYVADHPDTLVLTAADSDAGGMRMVGFRVTATSRGPERVGDAFDGREGSGTAPFVAAPDRNGQALPFAVGWVSGDDVSGAVLVRAAGINSHLVRGSMDNTGIAKLIRRTLFGEPQD